MEGKMKMNDASLKVMGSRLRMLRRERGLTLRILSSKIGVHYASIANWETDRSAPGSATIERLASFFGVNVKWLASGDGPMFLDLVSFP